MILRVLRVFRFFRLVHAFPGFVQIMKKFGLAMRQSYAIFLGLLLGCIIGMSLLNSVFVDAMVSDKNDDLDEKLASIEKELKEIKSRL